MKTRPTIAMIPSGYGVGKLHNIIPVGESFTWTRGSSATRVNKDGLIELVGNDVPRLDYSSGGCPKLLLENSSTNYVVRSEDLANSAWGKANTDGVNASVSTIFNTLTGENNASLIEFSQSANEVDYNVVRQDANITINNGEFFSASAWIKAAESNDVGKKINLYIYNKTNSSYEVVKVFTVTSEWQRIAINEELTEGDAALIEFTIGKARDYLGGVPLNEFTNKVLVYGCQLEIATKESSYIPTSGAIASRSVDSGSLDNINSLLGNNATLFLQGSSDNDQGGGSLYFLDINDTLLGRLYFKQANLDDKSRIRLENPLYELNSDFKENVKLALKNKNGVYTLFINGQQINNATEQTLFGINRIDLRGFALVKGGQTFIDKMFIYDKELTDEELINLTK
jgi:hypothetical protein